MQKYFKMPLNKLQVYCDKWGLTINPQKTKAMIINPKYIDSLKLILDGKCIETVNEVTYLSLTINKNGIFKSYMKSLFNKCLKACFKVKKIISPLPSVGTCLHKGEGSGL